MSLLGAILDAIACSEPMQRLGDSLEKSPAWRQHNCESGSHEMVAVDGQDPLEPRKKMRCAVPGCGKTKREKEWSP